MKASLKMISIGMMVFLISFMILLSPAHYRGFALNQLMAQSWDKDSETSDGDTEMDDQEYNEDDSDMDLESSEDMETETDTDWEQQSENYEEVDDEA